MVVGGRGFHIEKQVNSAKILNIICTWIFYMSTVKLLGRSGRLTLLFNEIFNIILFLVVTSYSVYIIKHGEFEEAFDPPETEVIGPNKKIRREIFRRDIFRRDIFRRANSLEVDSLRIAMQSQETQSPFFKLQLVRIEREESPEELKSFEDLSPPVLSPRVKRKFSPGKRKERLERRDPANISFDLIKEADEWKDKIPNISPERSPFLRRKSQTALSQQKVLPKFNKSAPI